MVVMQVNATPIIDTVNKFLFIYVFTFFLDDFYGWLSLRKQRAKA